MRPPITPISRDFIYQAASGEELDELPVFNYRQDDATFLRFGPERRDRAWSSGGGVIFRLTLSLIL